ncbi:MAG: tRNA (N(6)-L-threonylcarbamoyladenosine(37)-C(2))-methylthiotransferase [Nanoarchaeota archaeon]|nr:tRNA (N(6)-L-threonylcarbamoyladenosine(37)-C(2))-methylthiotransferase [Nanoarchaeota archaeon]
MEKIYFKTMGCSINFSESEIMQGILKEKGFEIIDMPDNADVIVVNICTVKGDFTAVREIKKLKQKFQYKKFVIAGCILKSTIPKIREIAPDASLISTHNIKEIVSVVEETLNDNPVEILAKTDDEKINLPKIRKNKIIGIIPISSGCLGYCAYCSVKLIKGKLKSYPKESIIREIKKALEEGCKEIWLTSQDTGAYGRDINSNLIELLKDVVNIDANFMVRIGMMNPNHAIEMLTPLIELYKNKKIFRFLHIPVQSGNDEILKKMKRLYTTGDFKKIVETFRESFENITIATDIIAGFPTETKEQFQDSLNLIEEIKPDVINISRFIARPGTEAAKMEQVKGEEIKNRSRLLTSVFDWIGYGINKKWLNKTTTVLIDEKGKGNTFMGRNFAYKPVVVEGSFNIGDKVKVSIIDATKHYLISEVVE